MKRVNERREAADVKADIFFGLVLGWIVTLVSGFRLFFLLHQDAALWLACGVIILLSAVFFPYWLALPRQLLHRLGAAIGGFLSKQLVLLLYFFIVLPVGFLLRGTRGTSPFYDWKDQAPAEFEGWIAKDCSDERKKFQAGGKKAASIGLPFEIVGYFVSNRQWVIVPCVVICLMLGLLGIFAQTAFAPMIYMLF